MKTCEFKVVDTIAGKTRKVELKHKVNGYSYCGMRNDGITHIFERGNIKVLIQISGNDINFSKIRNYESDYFDYNYVRKFFNFIAV
jgi:hypothetical protein